MRIRELDIVVELGAAAARVALVGRRAQGDVLDAGEKAVIAGGVEVDRIIAPEEEAVIAARAAVDGVAGREAVLRIEEDIVAGAAGQGVDAAAAVDDEARIGLRRAVEREILSRQQ